MDSDDIEIAAGFRGEFGQFVSTLVSLRLLDEDSGQLTIHHWCDHNPYACGSQERTERARKGGHARQAQLRASSEHKNVTAKISRQQKAAKQAAENSLADSSNLLSTISVSDSVSVSVSDSISKERVCVDKSPPSIKRFVKPSIEDVRDYMTEKCRADQTERFFDFYESKGWVVGKTPMKDWKAACRNWIASARSFNGNLDIIEVVTHPGDTSPMKWNGA